MSNILVLTSWSYKEGLIQSYTLPYLRMISEHLKADERLFLVTFEKENIRTTPEEESAARTSLKADKIEWVKYNYSRPSVGSVFNSYGFIKGFLQLIKKKNISLIHSFCPPISSLGYIISILSGKKLILDSFEPHADAMVENGTWKAKKIRHRTLSFFERRQVRRASKVIATATGMMDYAQKQYGYKIPKDDFFVKPACVNLDQFSLLTQTQRQNIKKELGFQDKVVAVYAGKLGGIYHDKEVFEFIKEAYDYWHGNFVFLMLTSTERSQIDLLAKEAGLNPEVVVSKFVSHSEIQKYLSAGDFALTPVKSVPTKKLCTPIKDGEYWALGLPVVITPNISDDSDIIEANDIGAIINSLDTKGYRSAIKKIDTLLHQDREELQQKIRNIAIQYRSLDIAKNIYKEIYSA